MRSTTRLGHPPHRGEGESSFDYNGKGIDRYPSFASNQSAIEVSSIFEAPATTATTYHNMDSSSRHGGIVGGVASVFSQSSSLSAEQQAALKALQAASGGAGYKGGSRRSSTSKIHSLRALSRVEGNTFGDLESCSSGSRMMLSPYQRTKRESSYSNKDIRASHKSITTASSPSLSTLSRMPRYKSKSAEKLFESMQSSSSGNLTKNHSRQRLLNYQRWNTGSQEDIRPRSPLLDNVSSPQANSKFSRLQKAPIESQQLSAMKALLLGDDTLTATTTSSNSSFRYHPTRRQDRSQRRNRSTPDLRWEEFSCKSPSSRRGRLSINGDETPLLQKGVRGLLMDSLSRSGAANASFSSPASTTKLDRIERRMDDLLENQAVHSLPAPHGGRPRRIVPPSPQRFALPTTNVHQLQRMTALLLGEDTSWSGSPSKAMYRSSPDLHELTSTSELRWAPVTTTVPKHFHEKVDGMSPIPHRALVSTHLKEDDNEDDMDSDIDDDTDIHEGASRHASMEEIELPLTSPLGQSHSLPMFQKETLTNIADLPLRTPSQRQSRYARSSLIDGDKTIILPHLTSPEAVAISAMMMRTSKQRSSKSPPHPSSKKILRRQASLEDLPRSRENSYSSLDDYLGDK